MSRQKSEVNEQSGTVISPVSANEPFDTPAAKRPKTSSSKVRNSKVKFSEADDRLIIDLKQVKKMSWKQIASRFEGRTPGALQVRYCTKLKSKIIAWSEQDSLDLNNAVAQYEKDKWLIIAQKLGNKFSPESCHLKYLELNTDSDDLNAPPAAHTS